MDKLREIRQHAEIWGMTPPTARYVLRRLEAAEAAITWMKPRLAVGTRTGGSPLQDWRQAKEADVAKCECGYCNGVEHEFQPPEEIDAVASAHAMGYAAGEARFAELVAAVQEHRHTDISGHEVAQEYCAICKALRELEAPSVREFVADLSRLVGPKISKEDAIG